MKTTPEYMRGYVRLKPDEQSAEELEKALHNLFPEMKLNKVQSLLWHMKAYAPWTEEKATALQSLVEVALLSDWRLVE